MLSFKTTIWFVSVPWNNPTSSYHMPSSDDIPNKGDIPIGGQTKVNFVSTKKCSIILCVNHEMFDDQSSDFSSTIWVWSKKYWPQKNMVRYSNWHEMTHFLCPWASYVWTKSTWQSYLGRFRGVHPTYSLRPIRNVCIYIYIYYLFLYLFIYIYIQICMCIYLNI